MHVGGQTHLPNDLLTEPDACYALHGTFLRFLICGDAQDDQGGRSSQKGQQLHCKPYGEQQQHFVGLDLYTVFENHRKSLTQHCK